MVGGGLTTTWIVEVTEQLPLLAVTIYMPESLATALCIVGFCCEELNPDGPDQENEIAPGHDEVRFNVDPMHTGPLLADETRKNVSLCCPL